MWLLRMNMRRRNIRRGTTVPDSSSSMRWVSWRRATVGSLWMPWRISCRPIHRVRWANWQDYTWKACRKEGFLPAVEWVRVAFGADAWEWLWQTRRMQIRCLRLTRMWITCLWLPTSMTASTRISWFSRWLAITSRTSPFVISTWKPCVAMASTSCRWRALWIMMRHTCICISCWIIRIWLRSWRDWRCLSFRRITWRCWWMVRVLRNTSTSMTGILTALLTCSLMRICLTNQKTCLRRRNWRTCRCRSSRRKR